MVSEHIANRFHSSAVHEGDPVYNLYEHRRVPTLPDVTPDAFGCQRQTRLVVVGVVQYDLGEKLGRHRATLPASRWSTVFAYSMHQVADHVSTPTCTWELLGRLTASRTAIRSQVGQVECAAAGNVFRHQLGNV
jgi:hypothetical protein